MITHRSNDSISNPITQKPAILIMRIALRTLTTKQVAEYRC